MTVYRAPHFIASTSAEAQEALTFFRRSYGDAPLARADVVVALGGDGVMLQTLHETVKRRLPIYGVNRGSVGFLMNEYRPEGLLERINAAEGTDVHPLVMQAEDAKGGRHKALAFNEVSLLRETRQAAKLRITVDGKVRLDELVCDGALVSTPAGSTAYNLSAHGPILPIDAALLALTPISAFRPRRWRGALLPRKAHVRFDVLEPDKRPVSTVADFTEVRSVLRVEIAEDRSISMRMLFDADRSLEERIISEQFVD
jgi:NAD+ kinase